MKHGLISLSLVLCLSPMAPGDWLGFRGDGSAVSPEKDLPTSLTEKNLLWKVKLPGLGASSPIVVGDRLFLTCYSGYGDKLTEGFKSGGFGNKAKLKEGEQAGLRYWLLCFNPSKGDLLWKKEITPRLPEAPFASFLREHGYTSSTPVSDGERVYVFLGKTGVLAFDLAGNELWRQNVGEGIHEWGGGPSPVLSQRTLVVNASIESKALVGLDKMTGKERWRINNIPLCWTSPVMVNLADGKQEVVIHVPGKILGLDPDSGTELWTCQGLGTPTTIAGATCSTPAVQGDRIFLMSAGPATPATMLAVRAGGRGEVTKTHLLWKQKAGAGICSPVAAGDFVYFVDGLAHCLSAKDGSLLYKERLADARGEYASPVVAGDQVYALTRFDGLYVLGTGPKFEQRSHLLFPEDRSMFNSTPALSGGRLFVRSNAFLYSFGKN